MKATRACDLKNFAVRGSHDAETSLKSAGGMISDCLQDFSMTLAKGIRGRPITWVLGALGAGLLLGRFKVRPVETVILASAAGLAAGLTLGNGRCGVPAKSS